MVAASREFVCVRPQTYQDAGESEVLLSVYEGPNGLQNTVFALLDPDGNKLSRGSRSPSMTYRSVERFVDALEDIGGDYERGAKKIQALPVVKDLRLALNVAAADLRPLVVVRGKNEKEARSLARKLAESAWSKSAIGRFHYVVLSEKTTHEGLTPPLGISIIQPEAYGQGGEILHR